MGIAPHVNPHTLWHEPKWGTLNCPHCPARDVVKLARHQITCGKPACRREQRIAVDGDNRNLARPRKSTLN